MITIKHCFEQKPIYVAYQKIDIKKCNHCKSFCGIYGPFKPVKVMNYNWEVEWRDNKEPELWRVASRYTDEPSDCFATLTECKFECDKRNKKKKTS